MRYFEWEGDIGYAVESELLSVKTQYDLSMNFASRIRYFIHHRFRLLSFCRRYGLIPFLSECINIRKAWTFNVQENHHKERSSISSQMDYVEICRQASLDDVVFKRFKSSSQYRAVLEHVDYSQGLSYLSLIRDNPEIIENLKEIKKRELGNPFKYWYKVVGSVSPTQIRYAKILQDLEILFGDLKSFKIAEIGAGYGGQAAQILNRWQISNYSVFDLKWPGKLTEKYIQKLDLPFSCIPKIESLPSPSRFDLVISNYAFSELYREVQESYLSNIILNCNRGYMIYNQIHENSDNSYSPEEFTSLIPGAEIFEEIPNTFPGNVLIVWGHQQKSLPVNLFIRR